MFLKFKAEIRAPGQKTTVSRGRKAVTGPRGKGKASTPTPISPRTPSPTKRAYADVPHTPTPKRRTHARRNRVEEVKEVEEVEEREGQRGGQRGGRGGRGRQRGGRGGWQRKGGRQQD